jgi:hypothetical protein
MSVPTGESRVEGADVTVKEWVARENACSGEESDKFETEFRGWLEAQEVGVEFGHCEGSDWERIAVDRFLRRHREGDAPPLYEHMSQLSCAALEETLTALSTFVIGNQGDKKYRWHLHRWGAADIHQ